MPDKEKDKDNISVADNPPMDNLPGEDMPPNEAEKAGLQKLLETAARQRQNRSWRADLAAGANLALNAVPDGMASGLLAGVSPFYGLLAAMAGLFAGSAVAASPLLIINTTSASALLAGQLTHSLPTEQRMGALVLLTLIAGAIMILFGLFRVDRLLRFVSNSVMRGFLSGILTLTILSQLPRLFDMELQSKNKVLGFIELVGRAGEINPWAALAAAVALALAVWLPKTKLKNLAGLLAVGVPSVAVALWGQGKVAVVDSFGPLSGGLPRLFWPDFSLLSPEIVTGALSLAAVVLVQGAGVAKSLPGARGQKNAMSRDFAGHGTANILAGLLGGVPVGGSMSSTALNVYAGATSRFSALFASAMLLASVVFAPGLLGKIAMAPLAMVLIFVSIQALKPAAMAGIWHTGIAPRLSMLFTYFATLFLPVQTAILMGIALSAALYFYTSSESVRLSALYVRQMNGDTALEESEAPASLHSRTITLLQVYGPIYYAGAERLGQLLPAVPKDAVHPVVILRLRGQANIGATMLEILNRYTAKLAAAGGRLYLTELEPSALKQLQPGGILEYPEVTEFVPATPLLGQATIETYAIAQRWLKEKGNKDKTNMQTEEQPAPLQ